MPKSNKSDKVGYSEKSSMPPLGIYSLGVYLKLHGYEVMYLDLLVRRMNQSQFKDAIAAYQPDFVGISTYTETYNTVIQLSKYIKKILPEAPIMLGGPHVSFLPKEALQHESIDFVIRGEGESTFIQLLESINYGTIELKNIKGLSYKIIQNNNDKNQFIVNPNRGFITTLDSLPWHLMGDMEQELYTITQLIITSRGCPGKCIYCASAALSGRRYRARSAENVFSEMYFKYKVKGQDYFAFLDDTFTANKRRLLRICKLIENSRMKVKWRCDSRADILTYEMIDRIKEVGCLAVHIGIESGCQDVIKMINKNIDLLKAESLVRYISQEGMEVMCSFIVGHHCDTRESIKKTIALSKKFKEKYGAVVALSANTPFPGTELFNNMEKLGVKLKADSWASFDLVQVIIDTKNLKAQEIQDYLFNAQIESYKTAKVV